MITPGDIILAAIVGLAAYLLTGSIALTLVLMLCAWFVALVGWFILASVWRF